MPQPQLFTTPSKTIEYARLPIIQRDIKDMDGSELWAQFCIAFNANNTERMELIENESKRLKSNEKYLYDRLVKIKKACKKVLPTD